jgi:serine/threonine protein kinase
VLDGWSHSSILPSSPTKANILIDQTRHARLADFGLVTIISDPTNLLSSSSYQQAGTARWMSPELIAPQRFGFEKGRPTKSSDCYALAMAIYEIVSGNLPFHNQGNIAVLVSVLDGERPPRGVRFTKSLWEMLERCWTSQPTDRPSIGDVLQCLEAVSKLWKPHPLEAGEEIEKGGDNWDSSNGSSGASNKIMAIEKRIAASSGLDRLTSHPPMSISTTARSSIVEAISKMDVDRPGCRPIGLDPLVSRIDSKEGGTNQVGAIQSHKLLTSQRVVCTGPVHSF